MPVKGYSSIAEDQRTYSVLGRPNVATVNFESKPAYTLWRCDNCECFVAVERCEVIDTACCPLCLLNLRLCGTFADLLGFAKDEADECGDSSPDQ